MRTLPSSSLLMLLMAAQPLPKRDPPELTVDDAKEVLRIKGEPEDEKIARWIAESYTCFMDDPLGEGLAFENILPYLTAIDTVFRKKYGQPTR